MGLGAFQWYWQRQTQDFGHDQESKYSCLTFDNRGMGASDKPILLYSTSEMAKDVLELLDQLGWAAPRSLHVVGISMGGMIAQELVCGTCAYVMRLLLILNVLGFPSTRQSCFPIIDIDSCATHQYDSILHRDVPSYQELTPGLGIFQSSKKSNRDIVSSSGRFVSVFISRFNNS